MKFRRVLRFSKVIVVILIANNLLKDAIVTGSQQCSKYHFPCENGDCVDARLWCDTRKDCSDGSDEKYCKKSSLFNKDPNKCPPTYYKCSDGPCIPLAGRCNGYSNCRESSDEKNCPNTDSLTTGSSTPSPSKPTTPSDVHASTSTMLMTTRLATSQQTPITVEESLLMYLSDYDAKGHSVKERESELQPSTFSHQRENARDWLLSQRRKDFGWGAETPRAITALYLSDVQEATKRNESDMLMVKQLEVQLSLAIARNGSKPIKLTELALYINALSASCKNPENFYGENLIRMLRNSVDVAQRTSTFVNPSVYLTLCINNATTYEDTRKMVDLFSSRNVALSRVDIQALAMLTVTCISRSTNHLAASMYENLRKQFLQKVNVNGFPGNVYEASLIFQALQQLKASLPGLLEFILRQQLEDGSFGDILSTYLVLPVLAGQSFLQMNDHCAQKYSTDLVPMEVLKNAKSRKIVVQYALNYGNPIEISQTIQMQVPEGTNFLDVMRLAEEINPNYRFMLDDKSENPVIYSIGGIPNDAEKGMFWTLYLATNGNAVEKDAERLSPYTGNIKQLVPHAGDEIVFWMRSL